MYQEEFDKALAKWERGMERLKEAEQAWRDFEAKHPQGDPGGLVNSVAYWREQVDEAQRRIGDVNMRYMAVPVEPLV
jgi:hypothetical protein